jgi:sarcosine oxidase
VPADRRCIVVGGGLLGLSSARALTARGWTVTVLEAASALGHERAGSKGDARIFRLGYPDPFYAEMALLARTRWHDLEVAAGRTLLHVTGQVTSGDEQILEAIAAALSVAGAPGERISAGAAAHRFPGIASTGPMLVEAHSGVLAADACLRALTETSTFDICTGTAAVALQQTSAGVTVETADGATLQADVVVDCAGPATLALLGMALPLATTPSLPQVAYFAPRRADAFPPVFIEWGDGMLYGLPVLDDKSSGPHAGLYKVSHHTPGPTLGSFDPSDPAPLGSDDPALLDHLVEGVARLLPALDPVPVATERCVYDNSPDTDFVLDRVGAVVVGCGTSGHAFKFGPLLGEVLADLAEDRRPPVDVGRFRLRRFEPGVRRSQ